MSDIQVVPLTSFTHGVYDCHEGRAQLMDSTTARELEDAGFLRILRKIADPSSAGGGDDKGKAQGDGAGQPSSVSVQAPVSHERILHSSKSGATQSRRGGK
jgi:hypothetical protein